MASVGKMMLSSGGWRRGYVDWCGGGYIDWGGRGYVVELQLYIYSYVNNVIIKNQHTCFNPAVLCPFSLLVSSFAEGSIQADLLLSHDYVANLVWQQLRFQQRPLQAFQGCASCSLDVFSHNPLIQAILQQFHLPFSALSHFGFALLHTPP